MVVSPLARILSTAGTTTFKSAPLCTAPRPSLRCAAFTGAFWPNTILWGYSGRDCFGYGLLRQKLDGLNGRRDECLGILESLGADQSEIRHAFSRQQAVASNFKRKFLDAPRAVQKRYARGLVSEIVVDRDKAVISGPPAAIAAAVSAGALEGGVRTSVREWRARRDSNS